MEMLMRVTRDSLTRCCSVKGKGTGMENTGGTGRCGNRGIARLLACREMVCDRDWVHWMGVDCA